MTEPVSGAERQRRYRERQKVEREAEERRALVRDALARGGRCECCGESCGHFLTVVEDRVWCRNCAPFAAEGLVCPHRGVLRRLG